MAHISADRLLGTRLRIARRAVSLVLAAVALGALTSGAGGCTGAGATSLAGETSASAEATRAMPLAGKVVPPASGAYLGVYTPPAPFVPAAIDSFEATAGKGVSIVMWYQPWAAGNRSQLDRGALVAVWRRGKVPMITWEPWDPGGDANLVKTPGTQPTFRLSSIVDGQWDTYIRGWARGMRDLGGPIMLRPMHEMNGNWYPWSGFTNGNSPALFIASWRRIHDIFQAEGATNVTWVWSINHESVPAVAGNNYAAYYPGDAYVDWTAISGFNWGTSSPVSRWRTFEHWYAAPIAYLQTVGKPICVAEFATVEQGGDKAAWLLDAYAQVRATPAIGAIVYYDAHESGPVNGTQDWRIDTSPQSVAGFSQAISPPYFIATAPPELTAWQSQLTAAEKNALIGIQPLY